MALNQYLLYAVSVKAARLLVKEVLWAFFFCYTSLLKIIDQGKYQPKRNLAENLKNYLGCIPFFYYFFLMNKLEWLLKQLVLFRSFICYHDKYMYIRYTMATNKKKHRKQIISSGNALQRCIVYYTNAEYNKQSDERTRL